MRRPERRKSKTLSLKLAPDVKEKLQALAVQDNRTITGWIEQTIRKAKLKD